MLQGNTNCIYLESEQSRKPDDHLHGSGQLIVSQHTTISLQSPLYILFYIHVSHI